MSTTKPNPNPHEPGLYACLFTPEEAERLSRTDPLDLSHEINLIKVLLERCIKPAENPENYSAREYDSLCRITDELARTLKSLASVSRKACRVP